MQLLLNWAITSFIACLPYGFQDVFNPCVAATLQFPS